MTVLIMAVLGGLGAVSRFILDASIRAAHSSPVPVGTLVINLSGSLLMGLLLGTGGTGTDWALMLGMGFLGGFTTFSTASVEVVRLGKESPLRALLVCVGMAVGCVAAAWLGWTVTRG